MATENVTLEFDDESIDAIAKLATEINRTVENIGARRLHTVLEYLLDEISFTACDKDGETYQVGADLVNEKLKELAGNADLSKFIL